MRAIFVISATVAMVAALTHASSAHERHHVMYARHAHATRMGAVAYSALFHRMAPADEYFGRFKESILEIRNRLDAFDRQSPDDVRRSDARRGLDNLRDAISDWQRKYPRDPWLPAFRRRLAHDYQRAEGRA